MSYRKQSQQVSILYYAWPYSDPTATYRACEPQNLLDISLVISESTAAMTHVRNAVIWLLDGAHALNGGSAALQ